MNQTVLITGGNTGIGLETALQLYERGYSIYLAGRNEDQLNQTATRMRTTSQSDQFVEVVLLDLSSLKSVQVFK